MTSVETLNDTSSEKVNSQLSKEVENLTTSVSSQVKTVLTVLESIKWEWGIVKSIKNIFGYVTWAELKPEVLTEEVRKKRNELDGKFEA